MVSELEAARREGHDSPCLRSGQGNESEVREYEWMGAAMFIDILCMYRIRESDREVCVRPARILGNSVTHWQTAEVRIK